MGLSPRVHRRKAMNGWRRPDRDTSGQAEPAHSARKGAVAGVGQATVQVGGLSPRN